MSLSAKVFLLVALFALGWGTDSPADKRTVCTITVNSADEKEMLPAATARRSVSVRRVGGARPSRLARLGVPAGRSLRSARHLRPFRREHRVLFGSGRRQRVPAGRGDGARLVQRLLPRAVLAAEGGLSVRVQHAECGRDQEHVARKSGAAWSAAGTRRSTPAVSRARSTSATARAAAIACVASS